MGHPVPGPGQQLVVVQTEDGTEHRFNSRMELVEWTYSPGIVAVATLTYYCCDFSGNVRHEHGTDGTVIDDNGTSVRIVIQGKDAVERLEREIARRNERNCPPGMNADRCPRC